jgi:GMP synthase (glutamine-hydrolysing)
VLGICYGMQLLALSLGGRVEGAEVGEFGRSELTVREHGTLFKGLPKDQTCWMSHRDTVYAPPPGFTALASSTQSPVAAFESTERACTASSSTRGRPHPVRPGRAQDRSCATCATAT